MLRYILATEETLRDDTQLPEMVIKHLEGLIRKGAEDLSQKWRDALHLTQTAFKVGQVKKPSPSERSAWKQYEELISYAVKQLARARGLKSDWRIYNEAFEQRLKETNTYEIKLFNNGNTSHYLLECGTISDITSHIMDILKDKNVDVVIKESKKNNDIKVSFYRYNIKQKVFAIIREVGE